MSHTAMFKVNLNIVKTDLYPGGASLLCSSPAVAVDTAMCPTGSLSDAASSM